MNTQNKGARIFISYSREDRKIADQLHHELSKLGCDVWWDRDLKMGDSISEAIQKQLKASDFVILVLSDSYLKNPYALQPSEEFSYDCKKRDINTFFLKCDDKGEWGKTKSLNRYDLHKNDFHLIDLTKGFDIKDLVHKISAIEDVSWDNLSPANFENMVMDLLTKSGFENIQRNPMILGRHYDYLADFHAPAPFDRVETTSWIVECKFYKKSRFTTSSIYELVSALSSLPSYQRNLLLITNSQFTSASVKFIEEVRLNQNIRILTLDGFQLKNLLAREASLIRKYFNA